jgi:hypothetical protein
MPADFGSELGVVFIGGGLCHTEMMSAGATKENPF